MKGIENAYYSLHIVDQIACHHYVVICTPVVQYTDLVMPEPGKKTKDETLPKIEAMETIFEKICINLQETILIPRVLKYF